MFGVNTKTIEKLLQDRGVLPTSQRVEVASVLLAKPQHLSAEQILDELRERGGSVSKATVYNTLKLFSQQGLARELNVDPSRLIYDSTTHAHHHFYNEDTGELSDIEPDQLKFLNLPELPAGTDQAGIEVLIRIRGHR